MCGCSDNATLVGDAQLGRRERLYVHCTESGQQFRPVGHVRVAHEGAADPLPTAGPTHSGLFFRLADCGRHRLTDGAAP